MEWILFSLQWLKMLLSVLAVIIIVRILYIIFSFKNELPFVPTGRKVARVMVQAAKITGNDHVVDLGSGTGGIIAEIASRHPEVQTVGVESSFVLYLVSRLRKWVHPHAWKNTTIVRQNFFNMVLTHYTVVFGYLTPVVLKRLQPTFNKLKSGSRVVLYMFPMYDTQHFNEKSVSSGKEKIFVYTKR